MLEAFCVIIYYVVHVHIHEGQYTMQYEAILYYSFLQCRLLLSLSLSLSLLRGMTSLALMYVYYIVYDNATSLTEFHGHLAFKV